MQLVRGADRLGDVMLVGRSSRWRGVGKCMSSCKAHTWGGSACRRDWAKIGNGPRARTKIKIKRK